MTSLEGPAILALLTVFGIGMATGALLLGFITIATVTVIKLMSGKSMLTQGVDPNDMVALDKAAKTIGPQLQNFITAINAVKSKTGG